MKKQYQKITELLVDVDDKIQSLQNRIKRLRREKKVLKAELKDYQRRYAELCAFKTNIPSEFDGWQVKHSPKGYYHISKQYDDGIKKLQIGKQWDPITARQKIADFEDFPKMVFGTHPLFCSPECCHKSGVHDHFWERHNIKMPMTCSFCGKSFALRTGKFGYMEGSSENARPN